MTKRDVRCPHCKAAVIAETRPSRTGGSHSEPAASVQLLRDPAQRNAVLLVCPACKGVAEWKGKRILIVDAA